MVWRRSYDIPPPPLEEKRFPVNHNCVPPLSHVFPFSPYNPRLDVRRYPEGSDVPMTESLKNTEARVLVRKKKTNHNRNVLIKSVFID
jgi:bisphosphoglycerate-dependent phosphoglycerate mutase